MPTERWILHADMDAFYASIEQRDNPALRGKPVIVGATSPRGVVAAASYEARQFGVRSAMPGFRARELCPGGIYLPSNMALYSAVSAQIQAIFEDFTPLVEPLALDEAFLDVSGSAHLFAGVENLARELKERVREATELNVSVGVGPNKRVAKIACTLGKPNGCKIVPPSEVRALLNPLPVEWAWGVGPVLEQKLRSLGIATLQDLAEFEPAALEREVGRRASELTALARGEDDEPVEADRAPKSFGEENTFEVDERSERRIAEVLLVHADAVARRLRRAGYAGRTVSIKIKLGRVLPGRTSARGPQHPLLSRSKTLEDASDDGEHIAAVARSLWRDAAISEPVRLLGVSVSNLEPRAPGAAEQLSLFGGGQAARRSSDAHAERGPLGPTLDAIRDRFGPSAIGRAIADPGKITHGQRIKRGES